MSGRRTSLGILFFTLIVIALSVALNRPPGPAPETAPAAEFSAERAMAHEFAIAQKPHPMGSVEHDRVRDIVVSELTRFGLAPQIQRTTGVTNLYQAAGSVENIVARLAGTSGRSDAVLLAAHYDSVAAGPGAGDDGSGVAALLETLRALRAGPPLANDVIFLFTDGEEDGLLGASAFLAEHPWAHDVRVAVNFEARGNAGVSQMFETSSGNGQLVAALANAAPHPAGSSLTYEIYKHMPNDTDMTQFKKNGVAVLNFAFIGHWEAYHTPLDNPQQLDRGSLQQHGESALSLARHFGNADFAQLPSDDVVYFNVLGKWFFHYPKNRIWQLAGIALVLFLAAALYAGGAGDASTVGIAKGLLASLGAMILLPICGFGIVKLVAWLQLRTLRDGDVVQSPFYLLSLCAVLTALWAFCYRFLRRKRVPGDLVLGGGAALILLGLLMGKWLPGGSYVILWPLLALLLAAFFVCGAPLESLSRSHAFAVGALSVPALLLIVPLIQGFYEALGFTSIGAPATALVLAILFLSLAPLFEIAFAAGSGLLPLAALALGVLCFLAGAATTQYSNAHPKPSIMAYVLDADTGKALWASSAARVDPWTEKFVGVHPARARLSGFYPDWLPLKFFQNEAPVLPLPAPETQLLQSTPAGEARTLLLRITSPRHARALLLSAPENEILASWANEKKLGNPSEARWNSGGKWNLSYANVPPGGIDLKLIVKGNGVLKLWVVDRSPGLPEIAGKPFAPRPADSMPHHSGDETLVRRVFVF
jgi:hypothetical protein